jgi:hypothetical protein
LIAGLVDNIIIKPEKHYGRVYFLAQIFFKTGLMKGCLYGPGIGPGGSRWQTDGSDWTIDLRKPEECKAPVFHLIAKGFAEPSEICIPDTVPVNLAGAAEHWLLIAKKNMNRKSYRVVPSKIRRFVSVVGDVLCSQLNSRLWHHWTTWLREEVASGRLQRNTAKVNWNRAREFVRWLVSQGMTPPIPCLETVSAQTALK